MKKEEEEKKTASKATMNSYSNASSEIIAK